MKLNKNMWRPVHKPDSAGYHQDGKKCRNYGVRVILREICENNRVD